MSALTLPGTLPGLLRRGSPLFEQGVVVGINPEMEDGLTHLVCFHEGFTDWCSPHDLALDLTDATGRAHAAWWLAERVGEPLTSGLHASNDESTHRDATGQVVDHEILTTWVLGDERYDIGTPEILAVLEHLDPDDPRLLEDGSRWVDAEALRLVCLHVAGGGQ